MVDSSAIGRRLYTVRRDRRMSQTELAQLSGIDHSTISRIERGLVPSPGSETVARLSMALEVSPSDLVVTAAIADTATVLPRTMRAIPSDAPASLMDLFDRQVEGMARLVFQGMQRNDSGPSVNDAGPTDDHGYFKMKTGTQAAPLLPHLIDSRQLASV